MSIPLRDPNFTVAELQQVGQKLLDAAMEYWVAAHKAGIGGAIIWLKSRDGFVIFTRGEYAGQLMKIKANNTTTSLLLLNIEEAGGPTIQFGHVQEAS